METPHKFRAMNPKGPGHPPLEMSFAEGERWTWWCPHCRRTNGGFIETDTHRREDEEQDPYCPIHRPCVFCQERGVEWKRIA